MNGKMPPMTQLIDEATQMLLDRSEQERELIYFVSSLEDEYRAAIMFAYQLLNDNNDE